MSVIANLHRPIAPVCPLLLHHLQCLPNVTQTVHLAVKRNGLILLCILTQQLKNGLILLRILTKPISIKLLTDLYQQIKKSTVVKKKKHCPLIHIISRVTSKKA